MRAIFIDDDGRFTYVLGSAEYDLGHPRADRYIRVDGDRQLCQGGGFRGNTLSWPRGEPISEWREATGPAGHKFHTRDYASPPNSDILKTLSRWLKATPYQSRATFERHYKGRLAHDEIGEKYYGVAPDGSYYDLNGC